MTLKVQVLRDHGGLKAGDRLEFSESMYTEWYFETGRLVAHDVEKVPNAS